MSRSALVAIGSRTNEDCYGVTSGTRVAEALVQHGWRADVVHASNGREIMRMLIARTPDLVVPVGFGAPCEDGQIHALARLAEIPCAGPTPASGAIMQDKSLLSRIVDTLFPAGLGIRSPRGYVLDSCSDDQAIIAAAHLLRCPLVVKPAFSGSSDGLSVHEDPMFAAQAAANLIPREGKVLIQELELEVKAEISCTVLDTAEETLFLPIVELRRNDVQVLLPAQKFGSGGLGRHIIPARISTETVERVRSTVLQIQRTVGAVGLTRTDILIGRDDEIVVLELNGIPGLLESSIACDAAAAAGISFGDLSVAYAESAYLPRAEPAVWGPHE